MAAQTNPAQRGWLWLRASLLSLALCLSCSALLAVVWAPRPHSTWPTGSRAGVCVEWGINGLGRRQVGVWWEASHPHIVKPNLRPGSSLRVFCGVTPWLPNLPTRRTMIYTW